MIKAHVAQMNGEGKRIWRYESRHIDLLYMKVFADWTRSQKYLIDASNAKYDARLKIVDLEEFAMVKKKIRLLYLEKKDFQLRIKKYMELFNTDTSELKPLGIRKSTL